MPVDGKSRNAKRTAAAGGDQNIFCPSWLLGKALCCIGIVVLMQNVILLRWGAELLDLCGSVGSVAVPVPQQTTGTTSPPALVDGMPMRVTPIDGEGISAEDLVKLKAMHPSSGNSLHDRTEPTRPLPVVTVSSMSDVEGERMHMAGGRGPGPKRMKATDRLSVVPRDSLRIIGRQVPSTVKLTIGFSSVTRKKDYILDTVGTMLGLRKEPGKPDVISREEREMVVTCAHLADFNLAWVNRITDQLKDDYKDLIAGGQFHVIHAPEEYYPRLDFCPPICTYKDDPTRVRWRSKQNIDYAFLMYYAAPLAPYYLQIEDDINFANNWVSSIVTHIGKNYPADFLSHLNVPWRKIDFSQLGFIGKAFQSADLIRLAQFLLLFYDQMPCDLLVGDWMMGMVQARPIDYWRAYPSLFQHIGMFRSLETGGFQALQELKFGKLLFNNPPATVVWNFDIVPTYEGKFAYVSGGEKGDRNDVCDFTASKAHKGKVHRCWLWAKTPTTGQHMTLIFQEAITMKAAFVEFGQDHHKDDLLRNGSVQVAGDSSSNVPRVINEGLGTVEHCGEFFRIQEVQSQTMVYWEEKVSKPPKLPVPKVRCLRVGADLPQTAWAIVYQIQIRSSE